MIKKILPVLLLAFASCSSSDEDFEVTTYEEARKEAQKILNKENIEKEADKLLKEIESELEK